MAWLLNVFTFKRSIYYGFPVYLVLAEYAIRFLLSFVPGRPEDLAVVSTSSTVTAAGLSLIAAVLIPKPMALQIYSTQLPGPFLVALCIYLFGMVLTELKELV